MPARCPASGRPRSLAQPPGPGGAAAAAWNSPPVGRAGHQFAREPAARAHAERGLGAPPRPATRPQSRPRRPPQSPAQARRPAATAGSASGGCSSCASCAYAGSAARGQPARLRRRPAAWRPPPPPPGRRLRLRLRGLRGLRRRWLRATAAPSPGFGSPAGAESAPACAAPAAVWAVGTNAGWPGTGAGSGAIVGAGPVLRWDLAPRSRAGREAPPRAALPRSAPWQGAGRRPAGRSSAWRGEPPAARAVAPASPPRRPRAAQAPPRAPGRGRPTRAGV